MNKMNKMNKIKIINMVEHFKLEQFRHQYLKHFLKH